MTDEQPDGKTVDDEVEPDDDQTAAGDRRLFGDRRETVTVFVGADLGLMQVDVATDRVGGFSLVERETVNCVATAAAGATDASVAVAAEETVLIGDGETFAPVGFGPAVTVGIDDEWLYAASPGGDVARLSLAELEQGMDGVADLWNAVGTVDEPSRFRGAYLAAADGLYQVDESLEHHGLSGVRDVTRHGEYAATAEGLYRFDGEWVSEFDGDARAVVARGRGEPVHALADDQLLARHDSTWTPIGVPTEETLVDLAYGHGVYVLTADGTLVVEADPEVTSDGHAGWRSRALGVREARRLAVQNRKDV